MPATITQPMFPDGDLNVATWTICAGAPELDELEVVVTAVVVVLEDPIVEITGPVWLLTAAVLELVTVTVFVPPEPQPASAIAPATAHPHTSASDDASARSCPPPAAISLDI